MFDAEQLVIEAIAEHTGVDPSDFSNRTRLRDRRYIDRDELTAIVANLEAVLGASLTAALERAETVGDLIEEVDALRST